MTNDVSLEALLNEIWAGRDETGDTDGYASTGDLSQASGLSYETLRKHLRDLMLAGRLETRRVRRVSVLTGVEYPCQGYRLKRG